MLQFETFDDPDSGSPALRQLPLYVEPKEGEVLLSWLLRLATRLQVSLHTSFEQHSGSTIAGNAHSGGAVPSRRC